MKRSKVKFWLFLSPALFSFFIVVVIPMLMGVYYSFTDWDGISEPNGLKGFSNYVRMFVKDPNFVHALFFTAVLAVCTVVLVNVVALGLALFVTQKFKGANFLRCIFFMPNLIGGLLLGYIWQFIFIEIFSAVGKFFGLSFLTGWLTNPETGFFGMLILNLWQMSGYMMLIYIAQIQQIPASAIEASRIDGASWWQSFRKIVFPLVMPAFTIGLFFSIANSFKMFDQNLALTNGGPYRSTEMLALNIYNSAFSSHEYGYAQAKSIVLLMLVAFVGVVQLIVTKRKEVEM